MGVNEHELASWGRRLAALLVDVVVLGLVIAAALFASGMPVEDLRDRVRDGETLLIVVLFLIPEAIYDGLIGSRSQTFGKMALRDQGRRRGERAPIGYVRAPGAGSRRRRCARSSPCRPSSTIPGRCATRGTRRCTTSSPAACVVRT